MVELVFICMGNLHVNKYLLYLIITEYDSRVSEGSNTNLRRQRHGFRKWE